MSNLVTIRQAIVDSIQAVLPKIQCSPYHTELDVEEIGRVIQGPLAALVVCRGVNSISMLGNTPYAEIFWGIYVAAQGTKPDMRNDAVMAIVSHLVARLPLLSFEGVDYQQATRIQASSLYSGEMDKRTTTIWGITWNQTFDISTDANTDALSDFLRLHTQYPNLGIEGEVSLPAEGP